MNFTEIDFPDAVPQRITWGLTRFDAQTTSPLTGSTQTVARGARWTCDMTFSSLVAVAKSQMLAAFCEQMADKSNMVRITDVSYQPQGSLAGSPTFASQTNAKLIQTAGWTPNAAGVLKVGDFLQLATDQLVRVTTSVVNADASGNAPVSINPGIRNMPGAGSAIVTASPGCWMQLKDDSFSREMTAPRIAGFTVSFIEVIP